VDGGDFRQPLDGRRGNSSNGHDRVRTRDRAVSGGAASTLSSGAARSRRSGAARAGIALPQAGLGSADLTLFSVTGAGEHAPRSDSRAGTTRQRARSLCRARIQDHSGPRSPFPSALALACGGAPHQHTPAQLLGILPSTRDGILLANDPDRLRLMHPSAERTYCV